MPTAGRYNVLDYAPSGVTINAGSNFAQSQAAIQAAIDAAAAAGGGTVVFPEGTYLALDIVHRSKVNVEAPGRATIKRPDNAPTRSRIWYVGRGVASVVRDVTIDGLTFDGNIAHQLNSAVDYDPASDTIAFPDIAGPYADVQHNHSLFLGGEDVAGGGVGCDDVRIVNCDFNGSQGDGIAVNTNATNVQISGITGRKCARGSFDLFGGGSSVCITGGDVADWLHMENDVHPDLPTTCRVSNVRAARLNALGSNAPGSLTVQIDNCRVEYGPQFEGVAGTVTGTTFTIPVPAGASTHRIIGSEGLRFTGCQFIGRPDLSSGPLVSLEPGQVNGVPGTASPQDVGFSACDFVARGGDGAVDGLREYTTFHAPGSIVSIDGCRFTNLGLAILTRRNGHWRVTGNSFDRCGSGYFLHQYANVSVESFFAADNRFFECAGYLYVGDNNAAIGANVVLYDRHWEHATLVYPVIASAYGTSLVTAVRDRRELFATKSQFAEARPACWRGARVMITDSAVAGDPFAHYKTGAGLDSAASSFRAVPLT